MRNSAIMGLEKTTQMIKVSRKEISPTRRDMHLADLRVKMAARKPFGHWDQLEYWQSDIGCENSKILQRYAKQILPTWSLVYNAFKKTPFDKLKAIFLG